MWDREWKRKKRRRRRVSRLFMVTFVYAALPVLGGLGFLLITQFSLSSPFSSLRQFSFYNCSSNFGSSCLIHWCPPSSSWEGCFITYGFHSQYNRVSSHGGLVSSVRLTTPLISIATSPGRIGYLVSLADRVWYWNCDCGESEIRKSGTGESGVSLGLNKTLNPHDEQSQEWQLYITPLVRFPKRMTTPRYCNTGQYILMHFSTGEMRGSSIETHSDSVTLFLIGPTTQGVGACI